MRYFHEEQRFARSWSWLLVLLVVVALVAVATAGLSPRPTPAAAIAAAALVFAVVFVVLFVARLETEVTADDLVIRFHGLWPTRRVKLADVVEHVARDYSIFDSGGWGVHWGLAGLTYNVSGNRGVQVRLRDGKRLLVGSQRAVELNAAIAEARAARGGVGR
ncbi:MAG: hypothetical protein E6I40_07615 [Chloroflexi bacterium]|nr:MAG: hypothetical protein E6I40_07615 [Chloroflexota bacterium]TMF67602.1 MAG: hypothetical protein E6I20_01535 [Chloroflexota bacterium]TMG36506.1 MAG: hypothetical protein E6H88_09500 [Chloroflexota bacterium]